jgi:hypothetical protein
MKDLITQVYSAAYRDNWAGALIQAETVKVHDTVRMAINSMTTIICSPTASEMDKNWAREKIDELIG